MGKPVARVIEAPADVVELVRRQEADREKKRKMRAKKLGRGKAKGRKGKDGR